jgi:hypothetical protein
MNFLNKTEKIVADTKVTTNKKWLQYFREKWYLLDKEVILKRMQNVQWRQTE